MLIANLPYTSEYSSERKGITYRVQKTSEEGVYRILLYDAPGPPFLVDEYTGSLIGLQALLEASIDEYLACLEAQTLPDPERDTMIDNRVREAATIAYEREV